MAVELLTPAIFSPDRVYRYTLTREIPDAREPLPGLGLAANAGDPLSCLFVCLNPSTADETNDDATVRRCVRFARSWGYSTLTVCNVFALRSRDPRRLYEHADPVGPDNDEHIVREAGRHELVVAAWGNHAVFRNRGAQVMKVLCRATENDVHTLGLNATLEPKHPLYLPAATRPEPYPFCV